MKKILLLLFFILSINAFSQVQSKGAMSEMGKNGFLPTVKLDSLFQKEHLYGLGPYGRMQGEITVVDGIPYAAMADDAENLLVKQDKEAEAPFFVYSYVPKWDSYKIKARITSPLDIEKLVSNLAKSKSYSLKEAFPFRIKGQIDTLIIHVVSPRSKEISGYKEGVNSYKFNLTDSQGEILGFYSETAHGVYTHASTNIHIHFLSDDKKQMGHIDGISISGEQGLEVLLPSKMSLGQDLKFNTLDTDFSKGRLTYEQTITLSDLEKFHGLLCDGLVVGALAMEEAMKVLFPN